MNDPRFLQLHAADNVCIALRTIADSEPLRLGQAGVVVPACVALGHKIAVRAILAGEKIIKYGVPIGSATRDIAGGEHVHLHNMKSDYLPTFTRSEGHP